MAQKFNEYLKDRENSGESFYHPDEKEALKFLAADATPVPKSDLNSHEQDALKFLNKSPEAPAPEDDGLNWTERGQKLAEGAAFGMTPYLAGGLGAVGRALGIKGAGNAFQDIDWSGLGSDATIDPSKLNEEYNKDYTKEMELQEGISKKAPIESLLLNLGGGLATGKMLPTKLLQPLGPLKSELGAATKAQSIIHNIKNAAASGAIMGAVMPTKTPDVLTSDAIKNRAVNAGIGGAMGATISGAVEGIPYVADQLKEKAKKFIKGTSFESGLDAGLNGMILKTSTHDDYLASKVNEDLKLLRGQVGGVVDERKAAVADQVDEIQNTIKNLTEKIEELTSGKEKDLKDATKGLLDENRLDLANTVETEKNRLGELLSSAEDAKAKLILENQDLFRNTHAALKQAKNDLVTSIQNEIGKNKRNVDKVLPSNFTKELVNLTKKVGERLSGQYRKLDTDLIGLNDKIKSQYLADLGAYGNDFLQMPHEMQQKYLGLGFDGRTMPEQFRINAMEPVQELMSKIKELKGRYATEEVQAQLQNLEDSLNNAINQHTDATQNSMSFDKFRSLLNTSKQGDQETPAILKQIIGIADSIGDKTISRDAIGALRTFDKKMRLSQSASVAPFDAELAKRILSLNEKYSNFSKFRKALLSGNENELLPLLTDEDKPIFQNIKNYLNFGADVTDTQNFLDALATSPNAPIRKFLGALENGRYTVEQFKKLSPENNPLVQELDSLGGMVKNADVNNPRLQKAEQLQGLDKLINNTPISVELTESAATPIAKLKRVIKNIAEIDRIESGPDNKNSIDRISALKSEIGKIMADGKVTTAIDDLNLGQEFKDKLKSIAIRRADIDAQATIPQQDIINAFNDNMAEIVNGVKTGRTKADVLADNIQYLKELQNPKVDSFLDKLVSVYDNETQFYQKLQSMMEKGADASQLNTLGSKRFEFDQFLDEVARESDTMAPAIRERLKKLVQDMKAREEHLRGVLSSGSLGFWSSIPAYAGNAAGLLRKMATPVRNLGNATYQGAKAFGASEEQYMGKNLESMLTKLNKFKVYNAALKNVQSNMNDFQAMDSIRRAATINSLLQNPDTREAGKQLQEEYLGK